jgi:HK97 family phage major capsid protein
MSDNIKVGARHSAEDLRRIQEIHDHALALGAAAPQPAGQTGPIPVEQVSDPAKSLPADALIFSGNAVKALGGGKIGGYLVLFGTPDQTDLAGDYFTKDTNFGGATSSPVLWQHGMDPAVGLDPMGAGPLKIDDIGVWIESQLNMRTAYEKAVYGMAEAGKLGWSSGTAAHLVKREDAPGGKASRITSWPLGLDASLTPTPAEPRTRALPLKSLTPTQTLQALLQASGEDATKSDAAGGRSPTKTHSETEGQTMSDSIETKVDALAAQVATLAAALAANTKAEVKAAADAPGYDIPGASIKDVKAKDVEKAPFKRFGDFLKAVRLNAMGEASYEERAQLLDHQQSNLKATGLNTQVGAEGGFLVGPNDSKALADRMYSTGEILSRVQRDPVSANSNGMTMYGIDESSRATGSRFGGVRAYWASEGAAVTKSKPSFKEVNLKLLKLMAVAYATDEMLADSVFMESKIMSTVPLEMAFQAEDAIVNGSGAGQPLGILSSPALVTQTKEAGQAATTLVIGNLAKMWARLIASSQKNAVILINQDVISNLFAIISTGVSTNPGGQVFVQPPGQGSPYFTYLGRPIVPVEYCATLGTVGDAILFDPSQYQLIDKGGVQSAVSMHVQFLTDEATWRFTYRVSGAPMWSSTLTPFKGSNTLSPYVVVETRS